MMMTMTEKPLSSDQFMRKANEKRQAEKEKDDEEDDEDDAEEQT